MGMAKDTFYLKGGWRDRDGVVVAPVAQRCQLNEPMCIQSIFVFGSNLVVQESDCINAAAALGSKESWGRHAGSDRQNGAKKGW